MSGSHEPFRSQAECAAADCPKPRESLIHVIDFYPADKKGLTIKTGSVFATRKSHTSCLLRGWAADRPEATCRWIHIPVNDAAVAQECVKTLIGEAARQHLHSTWKQKLRPAISDSPVTVPDHAWSMEPSIQLNDSYSLTLFLPYLNWKRFQEINQRTQERHWEPQVRHQRRTLDEFYHSGLQNMDLRNAGQTVSKWTGKSEPMQDNGRNEAVKDSLVIMVDQLWIWALDQYTLISCFPTNEPLSKLDEGIYSNSNDLDVMASVITVADLESCANMFELVALLARRSTDRIFDESRSGFFDMLSIYRWAAVSKAARHTELLGEFSLRQSDNTIGDLESEGAKELNLMLEIVDILEELNILILLFEKQASVVSGLPPNIIDAHEFVEETANRLQAQKADTERLHGEVTRTHDLLLELLDLEQKAASLGEARVTTRQGQAVMLFTIVTIIFLPLSFFTSYFGQNVVEFTGDDTNPKASEVWKVGAPISVVVIVVALIIAFFIMSGWRRSKLVRAITGFLGYHRQRGSDIPLRSL